MIGEASDAQGAIELAATRHPEVALLDVRMPRGGGPRAASEIARRSPDTRVIALSALEDAGSILEMLDAGAAAYVAKGDDTDKIVATIHRLAGETEASTTLTRTRALEEALGGPGWLDRRRQRTEQIESIIRAGGPRIVYQPLFDLTDGVCVGAEALSRFDALPTRSPERWYEEADKAGLRAEMELAALRAAFADLDQLPPEAFLSVNVSPATCCSPSCPQRSSAPHRSASSWSSPSTRRFPTTSSCRVASRRCAPRACASRSTTPGRASRASATCSPCRPS